MSQLPIDSLQAEFDQLVNHHHLVVEAETGSGKSTRLPLWSANHGRVLVIEPRRIACTSLAEFLADQSGQPLGKQIGYAIKLHAHYDENTKVVFVTPGVALRWFAEDKLASFDIVMVDEFHERRWDIDLLTAILKQEKQHRLIVTSATLEGEKLANYLDAKRLRSEGRCFPVTVTHRSLDSRYLPNKKGCENDVVRTVKEALEDEEGDILVFLPGRKEITQCAQMLQNINDVMIVKLHASVSDEERHHALTVQNQRKVVLATNVAETSLTIPNIRVVIDSGLERRTVQRNGRTALTLTHISKASAAQRMGRAGRVAEGACIRLFGEHAPLELVTPPELHREELVEPMLAAACCGYRLSELQFLDALPEKSLLSASQTLRGMEAIDQQGDVTEHGKKVYPLPIDALFADLVTRMQTKSEKEAMIDLAAALSVPAQLHQLQGGESAEALAQEEPFGCDASLMIRLVRGEQLPGVNVDVSVLEEAQGLAKQMREVFELPELDVASRYKRDELTKAIAKLHPELVFVRRERRRDALGNGLMEMVVGRNSRFSDKSEAALVLDSHSVPGRGVKQTLNLASVMLPVSLALLRELELGEWQQGETNYEEEVPRATMHLIYAGRTICTEYQALQGEVAVQSIVEMIDEQALLPGFAPLRKQQIQHWKIYNALGLNQTPVDKSMLDDLSFSTWLVEQLETLGVESVEDIELFDADDIPFEGIPDWEYQDFAEQFPLKLVLAELKLDVEYFVSRKLVHVIYTEGNRKGDPKRWELPRWSGWKVQYKKASRVLDVK
ncbi:helicase-related protein [Vibrio harveyi]|jgi:HrpA-like RNA helicase|uniref:helicase-related protein n=1 Tax=Vibrio harveyi TaxID=669 RepID=UPI0003998B8F|nr:helicase-related protein [Vibrio harveyi]MBY7700179.1 ATP-dependent RNA helicase [Vibrio harveyi]PNM54179.1 DEAD/DEAH box helicase [Vibrio harveyi]UIL59646.1 DEAD/DEAH box helicase [Vibrio harveyi]WCP80545.1 helicase-related protein [Vibrio harveyi]SQA40657.1 DEAD/DEAH box helicase [Vibrio harveyi]